MAATTRPLIVEKADALFYERGFEATINNARRTCEIFETEGSLAAFLWRFETEDDGASPQTRLTSAASVALSKELRKRGWRFVGPTTVYAFMQAMGLINDHAEGCLIRAEVAQAQMGLRRAS